MKDRSGGGVPRSIVGPSWLVGWSMRRPILLTVCLMGLTLSLLIARALTVVRGCGSDDARLAAAKSDIATISSAIEQYRVDAGHYPTTGDGLTALRIRPPSANRWKGPYLEKDIPNDPRGTQYIYQSPGPKGQPFLITSYGADGARGGDGENADVTSDD